MDTAPRTSARRSGDAPSLRRLRRLPRQRRLLITETAALVVALIALPAGATASPGPTTAAAASASTSTSTSASASVVPVLAAIPSVSSAVPARTAASATVPDPAPPAVPDSRSRLTYGWPTGVEAAVLRPFDAPAQAWLPGHRGVDLQSSVGAPVRSAADGVIAFAGSVAGRPLLSIDHADGIRTTYEPVAATVRAGDVVRRGDVVGALAADPRLDGAATTDPDSVLAAHGAGILHWGARIGKDTYVDPLSLLRPVVIRLLPL